MSVRPVISTLDRSRSDPSRPLGLEEVVVCVLHGGRSSEREVSLVSGERILEALRTPSSAADRRGPLRALGVEVLADGRWLIGRRALPIGQALEALDGVDVFALALHGGEGEDGSLQGALRCAGRAYTGSSVAASAVAMDKVFARDVAAARGLRVAAARVVTRRDFAADRAREVGELASWRAAGWVVKPRSGGSSIGCSVVDSPEELADALASALAWDEEALVEEKIEGVEATGGVLVSPEEGALALPIVEIRPRPGRFFDYQEKYSADGALELCPPGRIAPDACERLGRAALAAHAALACGGYSRSDFIVPAAGGEPVFLELNTLPGMTPRSLLPRAAAAVGIDYRTLCLWIVADGLRRCGGKRPSASALSSPLTCEAGRHGSS
jgi:D-alanine-D-alanine ligase